jgi:hypothetical protein
MKHQRIRMPKLIAGNEAQPNNLWSIQGARKELIPNRQQSQE